MKKGEELKIPYYVSDSVNRGMSTAQGTRKPVQLVVY